MLGFADVEGVLCYNKLMAELVGSTVPKRTEVLRLLHKERRTLIGRYDVASLSLFGSVARDQAGPDSDVDLLVEFAHPVGLLHFIELQQHLEAILGYKVDLGTARSLRHPLKEQVMKEAVRVA